MKIEVSTEITPSATAVRQYSRQRYVIDKLGSPKKRANRSENQQRNDSRDRLNSEGLSDVKDEKCRGYFALGADAVLHPDQTDSALPEGLWSASPSSIL